MDRIARPQLGWAPGCASWTVAGPGLTSSSRWSRTARPRPEGRRQVPAPLDCDAGQLQPARQLAQLLPQLLGGVLGGAVLGPGRLHDQPALLAVGLEVDPGDDL